MAATITKGTSPDTMGRVQDWARQTVAFALSLRAEAVGKPINGPERVAYAGNEAWRRVEELWAAAQRDCAKPVQESALIMAFARRVLDWVTEHRTAPVN